MQYIFASDVVVSFYTILETRSFVEVPLSGPFGCGVENTSSQLHATLVRLRHLRGTGPAEVPQPH